MASLFLSHSSEDNDIAARLAEGLRAAGFEALFLDFDPAMGIPPGRDWERELYSQLRRSDGIVFLASTASTASRWCFSELALARSINKPIFPVAVGAAPRHELLRHLQWISLDSELRDGAVRHLVDGLARGGLDPRDAFAWDTLRSPYPGLDPFAAEDAAVFFGRGEEIDRLLLLLQPTLQRGGGRFVAVVGPSGSGKSSLVRAGVVPRLRRSPERWSVLPAFTPGRHPAEGLARALARAFPAGTVRPQELDDRLEGRPHGLVEIAKELCDLTPGEPSTVLLVLDQAEELITRTAGEERGEFLELLRGALHDDSPLWVLATLRSEFLGASPDRAVADVIDDALVLEPLSRSRLAEVIERPAQRAGVDFEAGLVQRMVSDAAGGDALPLLAYTLRELYHRTRARRGSRIAFDDYDAIGGVEGALQTRADVVADELRRHGMGDLVLPTLLRLATVERDGAPTRRLVARSTLTEDEGAVVQAFVDARLLRSDEVGGEATIEVAHEALLRQWRPLRDAIEGSRRSLQMRSDLERLAADWHRNSRDDSYLIRGERLVALGEWSDEHPRDLTPLERDYLAASRRLAASELQAIRRSNRRLRALLAGLAVLVVVAGYLALVAREQTGEAQTQARRALAQRLAAEVPALAGRQPDAALLVGLESLRLASGEARDDSQAALLDLLARPHHVSTQLIGHTNPVRDAAFSPDGTLVVTAGLDRTVRFWDARTGEPDGAPLRGHSGGVTAVAFSPDGETLASGGDDETVRLWDVRTREQAGATLRGHSGPVSDVAFGAGRTVASGSQDGTVRLWDAETAKQVGQPLRGHSAPVTAVAFDPTGKVVASASDDRTVRLWNPRRGEPHGEPLRAHSDAVEAVAFSPDGRLLASAGDDMTVRLWNPATGEEVHALRGHTNTVLSVAFSPDGTTLASAGDDRTVRLWSSAGKPRGEPLRGHTDTVAAVAFSPGGGRLVSAGYDRTARLWQTAPVRPAVLTGHSEGVGGVAFSAQGDTLASSSLDRTLRLWSSATGKPVGDPLTGHTQGAWDVSFSPDGRLLASAGLDGTVRLWERATGRARSTLAGHRREVWDVAFSPDGVTLVSGGADRTLRFWDVASGNLLRTSHGGHAEAVRAVAFSPDGETVATGSDDRTVRLWDARTGEPRGKGMGGHDDWVTGVAFSPDGETLASSSFDGTVRLRDPATGAVRGKPLEGHTDAVADLAFSLDGELLATAGFDRTVRLWEPNGKSLGPLVGHHRQVWDVAFSPDSQRLASASEDHTVRIWNLTVDAWVAAACKIANRNLSRVEWDRYIGSDTGYERTCPNYPAGRGAPEDAPPATY